MAKEERIILGIDPGTNIMGYGIIEVNGNNMRLLTMGSVHLSKLADPYLKLQRIFKRTLQLIDEYNPDEMAIEAPFFGKNVQSMLKLGRAQGVSMAAALNRNLPIAEYLPKKVKQSVTGSGNASKEQVAAMLSQILSIKNEHAYLDATDAMGAALCHYYQTQTGVKVGKAKSWSAFAKENPEKIKKK